MFLIQFFILVFIYAYPLSLIRKDLGRQKPSVTTGNMIPMPPIAALTTTVVFNYIADFPLDFSAQMIIGLVFASAVMLAGMHKIFSYIGVFSGIAYSITSLVYLILKVITFFTGTPYFTTMLEIFVKVLAFLYSVFATHYFGICALPDLMAKLHIPGAAKVAAARAAEDAYLLNLSRQHELEQAQTPVETQERRKHEDEIRLQKKAEREARRAAHEAEEKAAAEAAVQAAEAEAVQREEARKQRVAERLARRAAREAEANAALDTPAAEVSAETPQDE